LDLEDGIVNLIPLSKASNMNLKDCVSFALAYPLCFLATTEEDQPHVRTMLMESADETGFTFTTLNFKKLSRQLHHSPKIEVCFYKNADNLMYSKSMRICGTIEFIKEPTAMKEIAGTREKVARLAGESIDPFVEIFKITAGDIHFWSVKDIMKESEIKHIKF
jgi:pyridoxamine 5'-phosphate oxidase